MQSEAPTWSQVVLTLGLAWLGFQFFQTIVETPFVMTINHNTEPSAARTYYYKKKP